MFGEDVGLLEGEPFLEAVRDIGLRSTSFFTSVVDAFLLRLIGYHGPYLMRTGGSDWEEKTV